MRKHRVIITEYVEIPPPPPCVVAYLARLRAKKEVIPMPAKKKTKKAKGKKMPC